MIIRKTIHILFAAFTLIRASSASAQADVAAPIRQFIDGFNSGDLKSAYRSFATGEITIADEFAPYRWTGLPAAQALAAAYDKHAESTGVTEGKVLYETSTRAEVEGDLEHFS